MNKFKVKKILLDLDGVIVDENKMFQKMVHHIPNIEDHLQLLKIIGKKQEFLSPLIRKAIEKNCFEKAEPTLFLTALTDLLIPYWQNQGIVVEILTSSMKDNPLRAELELQKEKWVNKYLPSIRLNFSKGSSLKQDYAEEGTLLIDDFDRTVGQFISKGGYGIHHTSLNNTMRQLRLLNIVP